MVRVLAHHLGEACLCNDANATAPDPRPIPVSVYRLLRLKLRRI
jgi:hypothetical protein